MEENKGGRPARLSLDDFLLLMAQEKGGGSSPASMRKYLDTLVNVMLDQLKLNDSVYIYNLGTFSLRGDGGTIRKMGDVQNGGSVTRFIKPKLHIGFRASAAFEKAVNENDFKIVKKKTTRRYTSKERIAVRNERRRKPRKCMDEIFCEMVNE